jgi:hypothetical protein
MSEQASTHHNRAVLERWIDIITNREYDSLPEVLHPDFVQEMPQSGERVVGIENYRRVLENLPGEGTGLAIDRTPHIAGDEERYVMTPTFTLVKVQGIGENLTSYVRATYPDGSDWYIVSLSSFKDGLLLKSVDFYAPLFDPPEWRSAWVETS